MMLSPISISIATPHSIVNAVTPGDYRRKRLSNLTIPTSKDMNMEMSWDVTTPATPCSEDEEEIGSILHHSMSNVSMNYTSDEHDTDYEDDDVYMSTSTSPATSDWESPVSSPSVCLSSPVSIPSPRRPRPRPRVASSRPWSGCLSCDNPHIGRRCTQALLLHLTTESCCPPVPVVSPTSHTCTSSCTHHSRHIHYQRPAYLKGMTLNPAGFVRVPLPETSADTESTTLGQRRLVDKSNAVAATATPVVPRRTSISGPAQTPIITPRPTSVFTFASTPETIEISAPTASTISSQPISASSTAPSETPRMPKRHSISHITIPQSILAPSAPSTTFVPLPVLRSASPSPSCTPSPSSSSSLAMCLSPAIDAVSELDISIEVPTVRMSPVIYATRQQQQQQQHEVTSRHMQRTASSNAMARTEEGHRMMSPPLPSSTIIPSWHNKSKYKHSFHHVKAPVSRKYHTYGILPGASTSTSTSTSTCTSTLPSSWTQPKLLMLYFFYLLLNAAFVLVLHH